MTSVLSNRVSNVPAVLPLKPVIAVVSRPEHCRIGVPLTLVTLALGWLILGWR